MMETFIEYRRVRPLLLSLAVCCLSVACTSKEGQLVDQGEIRLGVRNVTRAVNSLADLSAVGNNLGIYGLETASSAVETPGDWSGSLVMNNVRTSAIDASTGAIGWEGAYYYPAREDRYVRFCAYHPYAASGGNFSIEAPAADHAPVLKFTLSGREDVMYAAPVVGNRFLKPGGLEFRHVLTQLRFQIVDADNAYAGQTLDGIVFTAANASGSMNIETGELGAWSGPSELTVPGIESVPITGTADLPQAVGGEVMLQPGCESFRIRVATSQGTFDAIDVAPTSVVGGVRETTFAAGRSYLITLLFRQNNPIALSAAVVPWQMGGTGSAVVQ